VSCGIGGNTHFLLASTQFLGVFWLRRPLHSDRRAGWKRLQLLNDAHNPGAHLNLI
jgi:hypothetical protein